MAQTVAKWGIALKHGDDIWVVLHEQAEPNGAITADEPRRILPDLVDPAFAEAVGNGPLEAVFQLREVEDGWAVVATREVEPARGPIFRDAVEDVENHLAAGAGPRP